MLGQRQGPPLLFCRLFAGRANIGFVPFVGFGRVQIKLFGQKHMGFAAEKGPPQGSYSLLSDCLDRIAQSKVTTLHTFGGRFSLLF